MAEVKFASLIIATASSTMLKQYLFLTSFWLSGCCLPSLFPRHQVFTQHPFNYTKTKKRWHQRHSELRSIYFKRLLHCKPFTPNNLNAFMPRTCAPEGFYTKQPLHHRLPLKDFYTKCLLRQRSFTPEDLQTKQVLHQTAFTTNNFHAFTPIIAKLRFSPEGTRNLSRRKPFQLLHHYFHPNPFTCNSLFQLQPFLHQRPFTLHSFYSSTCFRCHVP